MLWTEKYRPKTFSEVIGNGKEKKEIQAWLDGWKNGIPQPALLLVGPPGTGKTTMAHIIANEFSEYVELNASDKRSQDVLLNTIGESSATRSLFGENRKLLIDFADLTVDDLLNSVNLCVGINLSDNAVILTVNENLFNLVGIIHKD